MKYAVTLFYTSSAALRAEKVLGQAGLTVKLIPTPRQLSSDCGLALRFNASQQQQVENLLLQANVEVAGIYSLPG